MHFSLTDDDRAFEAEVNAFIADNLTPELRRAQALTAGLSPEAVTSRAWQALLNKKGWGAPAWPREYGGTGWSYVHRFLFERACASAQAPLQHPMGLRMLGPVVMKFGTQQQRDFYLPRILSGEDYWCQGYSEPGAGSDLAALRTRAVRQGDSYIINGSKIWTTHAHLANRMFALVRTGADGPKQEGLSFIIIDMDTPGISVSPIRTIGGDHEVNQVFLDDVVVPAANLVGAEGQGWSYGKYLLEFERVGAFVSTRHRASLRTVAALAAERAGNPQHAIDEALFETRISRLEIDIDTLEMVELQVTSRLQSGQNPGALSSSLIKLRGAELRKDISALAIEILGLDVQIHIEHRPLCELAQPQPLSDAGLLALPKYLNDRPQSIFGGSAEIQHEILAREILPLSPRK